MAVTARDEVHQIIDTLPDQELDALRRLLQELRGAVVVQGTVAPSTSAPLATLVGALRSTAWLLLIDADTAALTDLDRLAGAVAGAIGQEGRIVLAQAKQVIPPGTQPLTGADLQPVAFWPEDEDSEAFETTIRRWRDQDAGRSLPDGDAGA